MNKSSQIKVRVAPSPTGLLHVGTAQSAVFNYLFARKNGGEFHVRIEDTDEERSTKEFEKDILAGFEWLGVRPDGQIRRSSDNKQNYRKFLEQLLESGHAFWCGHSKEELEDENKRQIENKEAPRHVCGHRDEERKEGQVIRLKTDSSSTREIVFNDLIRGEVRFRESLLGDISIARNLDSPLYHFAVVIDDIELGATHILRGEDHISNTPKHILIYEALGRPAPTYAHLPLLLAPDRSKLSKRHGIVSLNEYKKDYLSDAVLNYLAAISHSYDKDVLSSEELIEGFDISKVHKSGAVFDIKKLNWLNSQYVKMLTPDELRAATKISEIPDAAVALITERLEKLSEAGEYDYLWREPEYDKSLLIWKDSSVDAVLKSLKETKELIESFNYEDGKERFRKVLDSLSEKTGDRGLVYWPLRVALSGKQKSPDPVDIAFVIGKEKTLERIDSALRK